MGLLSTLILMCYSDITFILDIADYVSQLDIITQLIWHIAVSRYKMYYRS